MTFLEWVPPPKNTCGHRMPDHMDGKAFGIGTIWRCDTCGAAFEYKGIGYDQRDRDSWPKWEPRPALNGPDNRPQAKPPPDYQGPYGFGSQHR